MDGESSTDVCNQPNDLKDMFFNILNDDNDYTEESRCMITNEKLAPDHITLKCNHKFNYQPLIFSVITRYRDNGCDSKSSVFVCPYCRHILRYPLPYRPNIYKHKIRYLNWPPNDCHEKHVCPYIARNGKTCDINATVFLNDQYYCFKHAHIITKQISRKTQKVDSAHKKCAAILVSGKRKGEQCNAIVKDDGDVCNRHKKK